MKEGTLVRFNMKIPNSYVRSQHMNSDESAFKLYEEMNGYLNFGKHSWIPNNEVGIVIKMINFQTLPTARVRIIFPSGIGWLDQRDIMEVES